MMPNLNLFRASALPSSRGRSVPARARRLATVSGRVRERLRFALLGRFLPELPGASAPGSFASAFGGVRFPRVKSRSALRLGPFQSPLSRRWRAATAI
jgi:hypothetical protein